jgi:glycosyltransferase involved in cell wall biosynthesis
LRSGFGGATMHINQLIDSFKNEFDIYCAAPIEKPYGVEWFAELGNNKFLKLPYRSFTLKYLFRLISFIKKNKINIVHAHGKGAGIYARLAKIFTPGTHLVYTLHGLHISNYSAMMKQLYLMIERILGKLTDKFINVSNGEKLECIDNKLFDESKSLVIYNAIENNKEILLVKNELRKNLDLPINKFLIVSVIRFNPQKNVGAMLDIAQKFSDEKKFMFIIIGDGEEKSEIEKRIIEDRIDNVKLLGYKKNVNEYLSASDLFLSTSLWEGLPYSLIEATRAGIPIVASNVTGNNEVVLDHFNGYLFDVKDISIASKLIMELSLSPENMELFGSNSKKVFKDNFQLDTMLEKTKDVYSKIC